MSEPRTCLVIDPGKQHCGISFWVDKQLVDCALIEGKDPLDVAQMAEAWVEDRNYDAAVLVTEGQTVYQRGAGNPNDLLPLAFCCGALHALIPAAKHESVLPRIWTRGTPKDVRLARFLEGCSPDELAVVTAGTKGLPKAKAHNVVDSCALGRWYTETKKQ